MGGAYLTIIAAAVLLTAGVCLGAGVMYRYQRKMRMRELSRIGQTAEDILNGRKIRPEVSGEEILIAKIEHQMIRVQEMLEGKAEDAQRSRDEIKKLIAEIAHQMRTPLANVESYTGLLQEELEKKNSQPEAEYMKALEESEKKLRFLVESFVKMSRLEQRVIQIRKEETNLLKTVQNVFGQIQNRAEEKGICFEIALPEKAIYAHDPNWLGEALYNILDNAVKYSSCGGRIEVSLRQNEMLLKLSVRDYGIGIDPGEENRIFQRFYRGKRVTNQEGFGIGLYLTRQIVNLHGGFVTARRMHPGLLIEINLPVS